MENFTFYTPTKVVFGKDSDRQVGNLIKEQTVRKFLFITAVKVPENQDFWTGYSSLFGKMI